MAEERLEPVRETIKRGEERLTQSRSTLARARMAEERSSRILKEASREMDGKDR